MCICLSVRPSVCPSHPGTQWKRRRITKSSQMDSPRTLVFGIKKIHPEIRKGSSRARALNESGIRKIHNFQPISRNIVKRQWSCRERQFSAFSLAIFSNTWGQCYYIAICSPSSAFQWSQNAWPWMTLTGYFALNSVFASICGLAGWDCATSENNCVKTNKDRHILSAVQIIGRDSSSAF